MSGADHTAEGIRPLVPPVTQRTSRRTGSGSHARRPAAETSPLPLPWAVGTHRPSRGEGRVAGGRVPLS